MCAIDDRLPEQIECPSCSILLDLDDQARESRLFSCPKCGHEIDMTGEDAVVTETRFRSLRTYAGFLSAVGWIIIVLAAIGAALGMAVVAKAFGTALAGTMFVLVAGLFIVLQGLALVAYGQLLTCLAATEENTRTTTVLLSEVLSTLRENG